MGSRFYIGESPNGHALRIMRDSNDDPATTPRTHYDKFAFDSESGNLGYAYTVGSSPNISSLPYPPVVSSMMQIESGWWDIYGNGYRLTSGSNPHASATYPAGAVFKGTPQSIYSPADDRPIANGVSNFPPTIAVRHLVWQLPADNSPIPFPSSTGTVSGFYKHENQVRLPRAGFSIFDSNVNNFIIHENLRPAKIIRSGRLTIPAGQTVDINVGTEVGDNLFVGGVAGNLTDSLIIPQPGNFSDSNRTAQVQFLSGGIVRFRIKENQAAFVTYYIVAENGSGYTVGNGSFLRSFGTGSNAYIQMRRPGCAEPPNLSDILLDSRWGTMPLVSDGYVPKSEFTMTGSGANERRIASRSFANLGYNPIILAMWNFNNRITQGTICVLSTSGHTPPVFFAGFTGQTRYAVVRNNGVDFATYMGLTTAPLGVRSNGTLEPSTPFWDAFLGVRYYVFAVSQS